MLKRARAILILTEDSVFSAGRTAHGDTPAQSTLCGASEHSRLFCQISNQLPQDLGQGQMMEKK